MEMLRKTGLVIFEYEGSRDVMAPAGSCAAAETWGQTGAASGLKGRLRNQSIEKKMSATSLWAAAVILRNTWRPSMNFTEAEPHQHPSKEEG